MNAKAGVITSRYLGTFIVAMFICLIVVLGLLFFTKQSRTATLRVGDKNFSLEVASTPQAQALGLGNRPSLPPSHGMLFVFNGSAVRCMWMQGMRFPLDIIWLNAAKQVVHIEPDLSPATYPHSFCPNEPAKYVIELTAGTARSLNIKDNQTLQF